MELEKVMLSSTASIKTSLETIYYGNAGLNEHRKKLLERVPNPSDWAAFPLNTLETKDIAYLSAATHHEFAILRGKTNDILFHGTAEHCNIVGDLFDLLKAKKLRLIAHSHPDRDKIVPSYDDRQFLAFIGQKKSVIISYITGMEIEFTASLFDDLIGGEEDD